MNRPFPKFHRAFLLFFIAGIFCLTGCNNEEDEPVTHIVEVGSTQNAFFHFDPEPDSVFIDANHTSIREVYLDNDPFLDLWLVSKEKTTIRLTTAELIKVEKGLYFVQNPEYPERFMFVALDQQGRVKKFQQGEQVDMLQEFLAPVDTVITINEFFHDYENDQELDNNYWSNTDDAYIMVGFPWQGSSYYSWIKLNVGEYDNYVFGEFATFRFQ
jgi:hypothetical protein